MSSLERVPEANMMAVAPRSRADRRAVLDFVPRIGLSVVDYANMDHIDAFYLECQNYRDYYRDPYDRLHKPDKFKLHQGKCGIKVDQEVDELRQPIRWVEKRLPLIAAIDYKSQMNLGVDINVMLRGRYNKESCKCYKR